MKEFNKGIAYDEDVFERAIEIVKEKYGLETDMPQIKRIYKWSTKYIKKIFHEKEYCSINLQPLGNAYYHIYDLNKIAANKKNQLDFGEVYSKQHAERLKQQYNNWKKKYNDVLEYFELNRPKENVSKTFVLKHVIQNLRRRIKRRKILFEEVEEIQNNIK